MAVVGRAGRVECYGMLAPKVFGIRREERKRYARKLYRQSGCLRLYYAKADYIVIIQVFRKEDQCCDKIGLIIDNS